MMYPDTRMTLVNQFMGRQNTIPVPVPFVRILGDYCAAAFLSQLLYWSDRSRDPEGWFWKTHEEWEEELVLSAKQVRRCIKTCGDLIEVKRRGVPATNYFRPVVERIAEALQQLAELDRELSHQEAECEVSQKLPKGTSRSDQREHLDVPKGHNKKCPKVTTSRLPKGTSNTETTQRLRKDYTESATRAQNTTGQGFQTNKPAAQSSEASPSRVEQQSLAGSEMSQATSLKDVAAARESIHKDAEAPVPSQEPKEAPTKAAGQVSAPTVSRRPASAPSSASRPSKEPRTTTEFLRRAFGASLLRQMETELQPLGVDRATDWRSLPLERVQELAAEAQRTHTRHKVKVATRLRDLLDEEYRRISTPPPAERTHADWVADDDNADEGSAKRVWVAPEDYAYDPELRQEEVNHD